MALMGSQYYDEMKKLATGASDENTDNFFAKALSHDSTNAGKEFIPTKYAAEIITFVYEKAWHRQIFGTYVMDSLTESIPKFTSGADVTYVPSSISSLDPANQIPESSGPATDAVVVTLKTLAVNLRLDNKYLEYNANPQVEELLKDELSAAISYTESDVIVNGDSDVTHQDSDVTSTNDPRKAFDGLRKKALAQSTKFTSAAAAAAPADFRKAIQKLGKYALGLREDVVFIISPSIENAVLGFNQLETLEKYGPNATIITGEIGKLYGGSVVVSKVVREDVNDSGVYDGTTTTKTFFLACSRKHFLIGVPRNPARSFKISKKEEPEFDRVRLIAVEDIVFISRHDDAAVICYNITS